MADTLEILIEGCVKGDRGSQEELYRRFSKAMYGLCMQYASNAEDAQDILQDGFVKVFRKIDQVRDEKAFPGWIRRIMINTALERYRSQVHMTRVEEEPALFDEGVDDGMLEKLDADVIVGLIQQLTPKYRMVFSMYAIEGYSHKEIADQLGISEGTSKSNLSRARSILQQKVTELFDGVHIK